MIPATMKAAVVHAFGAPLVIENVPVPTPGPNEVLVSSTLRDLVIGSGLEFDDRGAHQLKGVPGEWHLFAVDS